MRPEEKVFEVYPPKTKIDIYGECHDEDEELRKAYIKGCHDTVAEIMGDTIKRTELPTSLEEAADRYASDSTGFIDMTAYRAFIAGAEWQKEHMFTHHEANESLEEAVTHQMEDDGNVDDFVRKGIDDIALRYAELGAKWQKEQDQPITGNSLEQEWLRYVDRKKKECRGELPSLGEYGWLQIARHFAEWQKRQMLKDAVEGEVIYDLGGFFRIKSEAIDGAKYKVGSWVKLIIVNED